MPSPMKRGDNPNICVYLKWMCRGQSRASPAPRTLMRITGRPRCEGGGGGDRRWWWSGGDGGWPPRNQTRGPQLVWRNVWFHGRCGDMIDTCDCVLYEHHTCLLLLWLSMSMQNASDKVNQYFLTPCNLMMCVEPWETADCFSIYRNRFRYPVNVFCSMIASNKNVIDLWIAVFWTNIGSRILNTVF